MDDYFTNMLVCDTIRGADATGVFGVDKDGNIDIVKGNADGYVFTKSSDYAKFKKRIYSRYHIVIGHNRKATVGNSVPENAHPFREDPIVLVHNGTIYNADKLNKDVEVDSHAIAHALKEKDAKQALGSIDGAFALVWYDQNQKTLNLARNNARPLFLVEYEDCWILGSEPGLILWLSRRDNIREKVIMEVPLEKILRFSFTNLSAQPEICEYENYVKPASTPYSPPPWTPPALPSKGLSLKENDSVIVTFNDDMESKHGGYIALGHLVFGKEIDTNTIVKYPMLHEEFDKFKTLGYKLKFFTGTIAQYLSYGKIPVVIVKDVKLQSLLKSFNGEYISYDDAQKILGDGCGRCKNKLEIDEIANTLIRKRKDNSYRVICQTCINASVSKAEYRKKGTLTLVH